MLKRSSLGHPCRKNEDIVGDSRDLQANCKVNIRVKHTTHLDWLMIPLKEGSLYGIGWLLLLYPSEILSKTVHFEGRVGHWCGGALCYYIVSVRSVIIQRCISCCFAALRNDSIQWPMILYLPKYQRCRDYWRLCDDDLTILHAKLSSKSSFKPEFDGARCCREANSQKTKCCFLIRMTFQRAQKKNEALKAIRNGDSISSWEPWGLVWKTDWLLGGFGTAMGHISKHWKKTPNVLSTLVSSQEKNECVACFTLGKIENMFNQSNKNKQTLNPLYGS